METLSSQEFEYRQKEENNILSQFSEQEQAEIENKRKILSSLAYFIGKDFQIPVELNQPGAGWHWDFKANIIRVDPKDLLEKPMDYLRFVISHEGGHRRVSRTEFIPLEVWQQPGFSFLMNAIEDSRDNNFVAENYPKFREQMDLAYEVDLDIENKSKEKAKAKLGYQPRFMQAGFEYIKQWFFWAKNEDMAVDESLPEDVKDVVAKTLTSAENSWSIFPARAMADGQEKDEDGLTGEESITSHARYSYDINKNEIWPEFRKLVEKDMEDQKTQELLDEMKQDKAESGGGDGLPQELKDKLSPAEQKELEEAIENALEEAKKQQEKGDGGEANEQGEESQSGKPIDLDSLSPGLKQKIKDFIDSLPEEKKKELAEKAEKAIKDFEKELDEELGGKLSESPEDRPTKGKEEKPPQAVEMDKEEEKSWQEREKEREEKMRENRKKMESVFESQKNNPYNEALDKTSGLIDMLTADLRDIFVKRKIEKFETGYRSGRRWNIRQRIREKIAGIPLFKTEAREQKENESEEMDYAVTLLIDLSGSMQSGHKIQEAFKSAVVLAETLSNLGVKFEIVGFQDILLEFKTFDDRLDESMREKLNQMILEVSGNNPDGHNNPSDNDDGACLLEASKHLANQNPKNKFLIVISDGIPATGYKERDQLDRELKEAIREISVNTSQKLIGIGLMSAAVADYYEKNISGVTTKEMAETLGGLLRDIIEKY